MGLPSKWKFYNEFLYNFGTKIFDLVNDDFKVALFDIDSIANDAALVGATYTALAADPHEVASGLGYTTGGQSVAPVTWDGGAAKDTASFSTQNPTWTGTDGGFTAAFAVLYDDTIATKPAIAFCWLNTVAGEGGDVPGNVVWPTGIPLAIVMNAGGVFVVRKICPVGGPS